MREEVRLVVLEPMRVAWFRAKGKEPEHVAIAYLQRWLLAQRLRHSEAVRIFGFDVEVSGAEQKRGFRAYEAWAPVPANVRPNDGVGIRHVPGGLFAVLRVRDALVDPYARIPVGWKRLSGWIQRSRQYRLTEGPCLEEHVAMGGAVHLDLFVPVAPVPRARPRRIPR